MEFIERCNLAKESEFEAIKVNLSEPFSLLNFTSAIDIYNKIYLFGGKRKAKERSFVFNPADKSLVPFEQENSSLICTDKNFYPINDFNSALIPNIDDDKYNVLLFNRRKKRFKKIKFNPEAKEKIEIKEFDTKDENQEGSEKMRLLLKKVEEDEKMPELPEGLIRFPTLEELLAPPKIDSELNVDIKPPNLNIEGGINLPGIDIHRPKIEGGIGLPSAGIKGPGLDIKAPGISTGIGLPGLDIKGPKIGGGIGLPGVDIEAQVLLYTDQELMLE